MCGCEKEPRVRSFFLTFQTMCSVHLKERQTNRAHSSKCQEVCSVSLQEREASPEDEQNTLFETSRSVLPVSRLSWRQREHTVQTAKGKNNHLLTNHFLLLEMEGACEDLYLPEFSIIWTLRIQPFLVCLFKLSPH